MSRRIRCSLALAAAAALAPNAAVASEPTANSEPVAVAVEVRTYALDDVLPTAEDADDRLLLDPLPLENPFLDSVPALTDDDVEQFVPDSLVDLLVRNIAPEEWSYEDRWIDVQDDGFGAVLRVAAPAEVHEQVRRFLDACRLALRPAVRVRVAVYRVPGDWPADLEPSGASDPSRVAGMLQRDGVRLVHDEVVETIAGRNEKRVAVTAASYLADYDVELAEGAAIHQPMMSEYRTGVAFGLRADPLPGGGAIVHMMARDAWLDGAPERLMVQGRLRIVSKQGSVERGEAGIVEQPRLAFASLAGSVALGAGDTAVMMASSSGIATEDKGIAVAVTLLDAMDLPPIFTSGDRALAMIPAGACLADPSFTSPLALERTSIFHPDEDWSRSGDSLLTLAPFRMNDWTDSRVGTLNAVATGAAGSPDSPAWPDTDAAEVLVEAVRGVLFVSAPAASIEQARDAVLGALPARRGHVVAFRTGGTAAARERALLCAAAGDAFAVCGTVRPLLGRYDVDVANWASIMNPITELHLGGFTARARVRPGAGGGGLARLEFHGHLLDGAVRDVAPRHADTEVLQAATYATTRIEAELPLDPQANRDAGLVLLPGGATTTLRAAAF